MNSNHPLSCEPGDVIHIGTHAVLATVRVGEIRDGRVILRIESPADEYVDHINAKGRENWAQALQTLAAQRRAKTK